MLCKDCKKAKDTQLKAAEKDLSAIIPSKSIENMRSWRFITAAEATEMEIEAASLKARAARLKSQAESMTACTHAASPH